MTTPNDPDSAGTSTRPYLIRALHDWCTDNGFTPYLAVFVDKSVQVPREYVKNNEIVLNVSFDATSQLQLGNEFIEFKARFGGVAREIAVPVDHVIAIYARENGQGMAFPVPEASEDDEADGEAQPEPAAERKGGGIRLASAPVAELDDGGDAQEPVHAESGDDSDPEPPAPPPSGIKPSLRRIK
jgi:stringent starvation protein B